MRGHSATHQRQAHCIPTEGTPGVTLAVLGPCLVPTRVQPGGPAVSRGPRGSLPIRLFLPAHAHHDQPLEPQGALLILETLTRLPPPGSTNPVAQLSLLGAIFRVLHYHFHSPLKPTMSMKKTFKHGRNSNKGTKMQVVKRVRGAERAVRPPPWLQAAG